MPLSQAQKDDLTAQVSALSSSIAVLTPDPTPAPTPAPNPDLGGVAKPSGFSTLVWSDDFANGSLDTNLWTPGIVVPGQGPWNDRGAIPWPDTAANTSGTGAVMSDYSSPSQLDFSKGWLTMKLNYDTTYAPKRWWKGAYLSTTPASSPNCAGYGAKVGWLSPTDKACLVRVFAQICDCRYGAWPSWWFYSGQGGTEKDSYEGGWLPSGGAPDSNWMLTDHEWSSGNGQNEWPASVDLHLGFHVWDIILDAPHRTFAVYLDGVNQQKGFVACDFSVGYPLLIQHAMVMDGSTTSGWHTQNGGRTSLEFDTQIKGVEVWE